MRHPIVIPLLLLLLAAGAAGCTTKDNPDVCCVSAADCAALGVGEPRPCGAGQACRDFACVAAECTTSADCAAPGAPVCADGLCVAACRDDADCIGAAGPLCAADGACVGCLADAQCPASAPLCDAEDRACRGCEADTECASGVCLEMDARCAVEDEVVFVSSTGIDVGECTRGAPCASLAYALTKAQFPARLVVHLAGGTFAIADTTVTLPVYLDGTNTVLDGDGTGPYLRATSPAGPLTLANVVIAPSTRPAAVADANAALRIYNADITNGVETTGGTITARRSTFSGLGVGCMTGVIAVDECRFTTELVATSCQLTASSSVFDINVGLPVSASGGLATLENNLFIRYVESEDAISLNSNAPGSRFRFNTVVNVSAVASDGVALACDSTLDVTSNIFAYNSTQPHGTSTCAARYSVYDAVALPAQTGGVGNRVADGAAIFANRNDRDFHLSPGSAALGAGEASAGVTRDLEGHPRPDPIGSAPDSGAYEAP